MLDISMVFGKGGLQVCVLVCERFRDSNVELAPKRERARLCAVIALGVGGVGRAALLNKLKKDEQTSGS